MIQNEPIIMRQDMIQCAICAQAPCDGACEKLNPSDLLRSIWFRNEQPAALRLPEENPCLNCRTNCNNFIRVN